MPYQTFAPKYAKGSLPVPKFRKVRDLGKSQNALKFFQYWKDTETSGPDDAKDQSDLVIVKVYRTFPIIDFRLIEPDRKTVETEELRGAIPFKPEDYHEWFVDRYGHGAWKLIMQDASSSGGVVQEAHFEAHGNLDHQQAKIDLRTMIRSNTQNQEYIRQLQARNVRLPWDDGTSDEEKKEMAAGTEALKTVTDSFVRLAEKNMETTEAKAKAEIELAQTKGPSPEDTATNRSIEIMAESASKTIDMVTRHAGNNFDPLALIQAVKEMHPPAAAPIDLAPMFLLMEKSHERALAASERHQEMMLKVLEQRQPAPTAIVPAVASDPPKSFTEQLNETLDLVDRLRGIRGGGGGNSSESPREPAEPREPPKTVAMMIMENMPMIMGIMTMGGVILYNMRAKPGEPLKDPMQELARAGQQPPPMPGMTPGSAPAPQPSAGPMPGMPGNPNPLQAYAAFIPQIEKAFLAHFYGGADGMSGYTFAQWLQSNGTGGSIVPEGRAVYMRIREALGPRDGQPIKGCGLDQLIRQYDGIWSKVQGIPREYDRFMSEFFGYDEWVASQQEGMEDRDLSSAPPPKPSPAAN
jgi:hypothetical protein